MNWGHYVIGAFIGFAIVVITMVTISMKQDVNLVATDYYKQEIAYQGQINKMKNYSSLPEKPTFHMNSATGVLQIFFPQSLADKLTSGTIQLYKPSEYSEDQLIVIKLTDDGSQNIQTTSLKKGFWKAKINFQIGNDQYYYEQKLTI